MFRFKVPILMVLFIFISGASFGKDIAKGTIILKGESNLDIRMSESEIENSSETGAIPFSGTINDSPSISSNIKY